MQFQRATMSDYVFGGQQLRQGDQVIICCSSGNHDATALEAADCFDITHEHLPVRYR